jgi:hypothetical protein
MNISMAVVTIISLYFLWEKFVWYKSKELERIKDVYRGTTVPVYMG